MQNKTMTIQDYTALARQAAAEGIVMLKNHRQVLPLQPGSRVAVFGRIQFDYYKSGTGSGGMVNTPYVVGILDALKKEDLVLNEQLMQTYADWITEHPFDLGKGWGQEPWSQAEMPLSDKTVGDAAAESDIAIVIIGRTSGEDQDAVNEKGSYLLSDLEEDMLQKVCKAFSKVIVLLNVGGILDMSWVETYDPAAVLYVWQGGMEGGHGAADVLMGRVSPCGKLSDTIARDISDYPSHGNFGNADKNYHEEDIYVGYRYFETFAKDRVLYPFGHGLSYTKFAVESLGFEKAESQKLRVSVTNTGSHPGKEAVQVYIQAPQGALGKPVRALADFAKTRLLQPGETEVLELEISEYRIASYDDSGVTGHPYCYVLEAGEYVVHVGSSVRSTVEAGRFVLPQTKVIQQLSQSAAPRENFRRLHPAVGADGQPVIAWEPAPLRTESVAQHIAQAEVPQIPYTGDKGYKLIDVYDGKVTLDDFVAQLSDYDMCCMVKGEGMCSPKVTPGTAAAFGGLTPELAAFGIPCAACSDGPSGIRMDCGTLAFSLPGGFCLASTFDKKLVEALYAYEGAELRRNKIDTLLGPGMNIHRHPLNGRNFEYFSEDPILTGEIAAAQLKGMGQFGVTGTIKHFACNNQEFHRREIDPVLSERALREIYLKGFEIAIKDGGGYCVMTTYAPLNGIWTAGNYDLCTRILREEWGFAGMVMTDWGADISEEGLPQSTQKYAAMVRAQNDVYMTIWDTTQEMGDLQQELAAGKLTRAQLARSAKNVLTMLMKSPCILHLNGRTDPRDKLVEGLQFDGGINVADIPMMDYEAGMHLPVDGICTDRGGNTVFGIRFPLPHDVTLHLSARVESYSTAQYAVSAFSNGIVKDTKTIMGTCNDWVDLTLDLGWNYCAEVFISLFFTVGGMQIRDMWLEEKA